MPHERTHLQVRRCFLQFLGVILSEERSDESKDLQFASQTARHEV